MSILAPNSHILCREVHQCKKTVKRDCKAESFWDTSRPAFVELEPITDAEHLDLILDKAKQSSQPIVIDWYTKLEKLAAEYDTKYSL